MTQIEHNKRNLKHFIDKFNDWFHEAVNPRIIEIGEEIKNIEVEIKSLTFDLTGKMVNMYGEPSEGQDYERPCDGDVEIYGDLANLDYDLQILKEQQLAVESMRFVYLYKSFEIILKDIIFKAFPEVNIRELFQWENVKFFLKSNGIQIGEVKEYKSINEMRIINNNIKHSDAISEETKKQNITEFKGKEEFDFHSLNLFYVKMKDKPKIFLTDLTNKIIACLYVYDDERINKIANDFKKTMDVEAGKKLINELNKIYLSRM